MSDQPRLGRYGIDIVKFNGNRILLPIRNFLLFRQSHSQALSYHYFHILRSYVLDIHMTVAIDILLLLNRFKVSKKLGETRYQLTREKKVGRIPSMTS